MFPQFFFKQKNHRLKTMEQLKINNYSESKKKKAIKI